jgi:hypothetical protein
MKKHVLLVLAIPCLVLASCFLFTPEGLLKPTDLTATAITGSRIDLQWADNANTETGYAIERKGPDDKAFIEVGTAGEDANAYMDLTVEGGSTYAYRVRASNEKGYSEYSDEASATTEAATAIKERARGTSPLYFAFNDASRLLWWGQRDPSSTSNYARVEINDATPSQQSGNAIAMDYSAADGLQYFAYTDLSNKLWYVPHDPSAGGNAARVAINDASPTQQSGTAISVAYDSDDGLLYFAYVDTFGNLYYVPHNPDTPGVNMARESIADAGGTGYTGTAISVDYDSVEGVLYFAYADLDGKLWWVKRDPNAPGDRPAHVAITDAGGTQQSGSAISVDYDPDSLLLWFVFAEATGSHYLWFVPQDPTASVSLARSPVTDAGGAQQSGTAVDVDWDTADTTLWVAWADLDGKLWHVPMCLSVSDPAAKEPVTDVSGTQQAGSTIAICF